MCCSKPSGANAGSCCRFLRSLLGGKPDELRRDVRTLRAAPHEHVAKVTLGLPRHNTARAVQGFGVGISPMSRRIGRRSVVACREEVRAWLTG